MFWFLRNQKLKNASKNFVAGISRSAIPTYRKEYDVLNFFDIEKRPISKSRWFIPFIKLPVDNLLLEEHYSVEENDFDPCVGILIHQKGQKRYYFWCSTIFKFIFLYNYWRDFFHGGNNIRFFICKRVFAVFFPWFCTTNRVSNFSRKCPKVLLLELFCRYSNTNLMKLSASINPTRCEMRNFYLFKIFLKIICMLDKPFPHHLNGKCRGATVPLVHLNTDAFRHD